MSIVFSWLFFIFLIFAIPPVCLGIIRKTKARLQNRIGASPFQPYADLLKMLRKAETVSDYASWVFRSGAAGNAAVMILIAMSTPWIPFGPRLMNSCDLFLVIYLFVLLRFLTLVSSLDTSSPFGGFGASREIVLPVLVEPGIILCLGSLAVLSQTTDLNRIFSYASNAALADQSGIWILAGVGLYLASLIELSRMPADDPTTHLELTMVHEAMILENSGPNLALIEYAHALKLMVLMGLSAQCLLHSIPSIAQPSWIVPIMMHGTDVGPAIVQGLSAIIGLIVLLLTTACIECSAVKLRWTKLPEFIAYAVTFGLLCAVFVLGV